MWNPRSVECWIKSDYYCCYLLLQKQFSHYLIIWLSYQPQSSSLKSLDVQLRDCEQSLALSWCSFSLNKNGYNTFKIYQHTTLYIHSMHLCCRFIWKILSPILRYLFLLPQNSSNYNRFTHRKKQNFDSLTTHPISRSFMRTNIQDS